jgi:hypothetical protein
MALSERREAVAAVPDQRNELVSMRSTDGGGTRHT